MLMSVCPTVTVLRFYGCSHTCFNMPIMDKQRVSFKPNVLPLVKDFSRQQKNLFEFLKNVLYRYKPLITLYLFKVKYYKVKNVKLNLKQLNGKLNLIKFINNWHFYISFILLQINLIKT